MGSTLALPLVSGKSGRSVLETIGNTPLVRLERVSRPFPGIDICAKAEFLNPGGSVKDRAALSMILDGEWKGDLAPGRTILDASSGNTAIAYGLIGAARGYRTRICMPLASFSRASAAEVVSWQLRTPAAM